MTHFVAPAGMVRPPDRRRGLFDHTRELTAIRDDYRPAHLDGPPDPPVLPQGAPAVRPPSPFPPGVGGGTRLVAVPLPPRPAVPGEGFTRVINTARGAAPIPPPAHAAPPSWQTRLGQFWARVRQAVTR